MKNKLTTILFLTFIMCKALFAEEYKFEVKEIELTDNANIINAYDGKIYSKDKDLEIVAEKFNYNKKLNLLEAYNGSALINSNNLSIKFNKLNIDNNKSILKAMGDVKIIDYKNSLDIETKTLIFDKINNFLTATDGVEINDTRNTLNILTKTILFDRENQILNSNTNSILQDKYNNKLNTKNFEHNLNNNLLKITNAVLEQTDKNIFEIKSAMIDTKLNTLIGENISIELNKGSLNSLNEPRIKGRSIKHNKNSTEVSKGVFTPCKKTDSCPPWQLSAEKITHNKKKKNINYENVWLKVYDIPVLYFPKFFHPDPTVKRQSGFLMPSFKNSPNNNTFLSIPYFHAISENKDMTLTPRFYSNDKLLVQTEYRVANRNSDIISDVSILKDQDTKTNNHIFYNLNKKINFEKFNTSNLNLNIEYVSNDTYLKANKIKSPLIKNQDLLENSIGIDLISDDMSIETDFIMFENLNKKKSDRFEYIFPKINLTKIIENKTKYDGNFLFKSNNYIQNYNTNVLEKINTNDLIFTSFPTISNKGFYNNYELILKNSNSDTKNSTSFKEGKDLYFSGLLQYNSSLPLIKNKDNLQRLIKPKISLKFSPSHTKDLSSEDNRIDVNNIFDLNRLSSNDTLEGGTSLTYGSDYTISNIDNLREIFSLKLANNLRLDKNDDLQRNNQLGSKTSNFFGEITYSPINSLKAKYNLSTKNNLSDINYQNLTAEISINNFVTTFDYLNENNSQNTSYLLNKTTYNFNEKNNLSFAVRENKKTSLTEYYNLIYEYKNDCLAATIEYNKEYYSDRDIKPEESIFFRVTLIPFGETSTPNLRK